MQLELEPGNNALRHRTACTHETETAAGVLGGKSATWSSPMLGVIAAASAVPGVAGEFLVWWAMILYVKTEQANVCPRDDEVSPPR